MVDGVDDVLIGDAMLARRVVNLHTAVKGITKLSFAQLRSAFPVLKNPANNHRAVALTFDEFHYAFSNTMSDEDAIAA
jgi:hypothetical protein